MALFRRRPVSPHVDRGAQACRLDARVGIRHLIGVKDHGRSAVASRQAYARDAGPFAPSCGLCHQPMLVCDLTGMVQEHTTRRTFHVKHPPVHEISAGGR